MESGPSTESVTSARDAEDIQNQSQSCKQDAQVDLTVWPPELLQLLEALS